MNDEERGKFLRLIQKMKKSPEFEGVTAVSDKEARSMFYEAYDPHNKIFKYRFAGKQFYMNYDALTSEISILVYPDDLDFMLKLPKRSQFTLKAVKEVSKERIRKRYNV